MAENIGKTIATYNAEKQILVKGQVSFAFTAQVGNTGVSNNADGRKVIKAGTPVGHATKDFLQDRNTVLIVTNSSSNGENAQGLVLHDIDVTDGAVATSVVVFGCVDTTKCPTIDSTAVEALTRIVFVKGE